MPDQPPSDWIDSNPNQPPNDWVDSSSNQPSKSPEPDWGDWAIEQGLSIVPPIAGAMLGGPAGGALGGFGGSYLRQLYDVNKGFKKDINPWVMGTEAVLGGLPIPGHVPGAGATAEELMKYAAKAPLRGAAEGAVIGGGASIPMSYAETGEAPSWGEVGKSALAGGAFGLAGGAAFGSIPAYARAHAPETPPAFMRPGNIVPPTEPPTGGAARPLSDEMPAFMRPPSHEVNEPPPVTQQPQIPPESALAGVSGQPVAIKGLDEAAKANLRKQGYKPNGFDADGFPIWALPPGGAQKSEIPAPARGATPFHEDDTIPIPPEKLRDKTFVSNLTKGGMELVGYDEQGNGLFKRSLASFEPQEMLIKPPEDAFNQGQGAQPGEQTGRVADFPNREYVPRDKAADRLEIENASGHSLETISDAWHEIAQVLKDIGHPDAAHAEEMSTLADIKLGNSQDIQDFANEPPTADGIAESNRLKNTMFGGVVDAVPADRPVSFDINNPANEISPTGDVSAIRQRNTLRPVENQQDVNLGQFTDDQIRKYLIKEDVTTPEMHDINMPPQEQEMRRPRADQMYGPGEFQKEIETIPRMSVERAQETADRFDNMIRTVQERNPERVNTIKQLTIIRDTALDRVKGHIPSTWGTRIGIEITKPPTAEEMKVPGYKEGNTGLPNVAMGGANERTLDVLGSSLYSRERPITVIKELMQNFMDEHKEHGITEPGRILIDNDTKNPRTNANSKSITVRDRGQGLAPNEIYTVLTNIGETGKAGVESASGGFGFAKASPFLGGKYARVTSIIDTPKGRMKYTFEGTPAELKNQARGTAVNAERVGNDIPTGLEVTTYYDADISGFYNVEDWAKNMAERSSSNTSDVKVANTYNANPAHARRWLDETPQNPIPPTEYNRLKNNENTYSQKPQPTLMDTVETEGAKINIHYDIKPNTEVSEAELHMMNKGMYQGSRRFSYGGDTANVPDSIVADIIAKVEEGHDKYPFTANREQMHGDVTKAINDWVKDNILTGVTKKKVAEIQRKYDAIAPIHPNGETGVSFLNDNNFLDHHEFDEITNHPVMVQGIQALEDVHKELLGIADTLGWTPQDYGATWTVPSERLKKFGLLFQPPSSRGTTMGIHIPRPDDMNNSAILINLMEHLMDAKNNLSDPIDQLTTALFATLAHEDAHIPGGSHDKGFAYRDADLRSKLGQMNTGAFLDTLGKVFDDGTGQLKPEIHDLLSVYEAARGRAQSEPNALLATGISSERPPNNPIGAEANVGGIDGGETPIGPVAKEKEPSVLRELYNAPRAFTTPLDLSASARQGLPLVTRKEWWTSWKQQLSALGSEKGYQKTLADLKKRPLFQAQVDMTTGKVEKSFAEKVGMKLSDVSTNLNKREESVASNWLETGKMFGKDNPVQGAYKATIGDAARASNRAYTAFLNQLRADTFESLLKEAHADFSAGTKGARNPYEDLTFAREIADYVNTATGRGPLKIARPTIEGGRVGLKESSFEQHAKLLTDSLFSPRLFASRVRMLNPGTYMMASPFVRKQYVKSLLSVAGAWGTIAALGKMAGADVSLDPNSADFGKIRIGNTRLDPAGGFQQYLVAASRLISGHTTSSASGTDFELGQGYRPPTRLTIAQNFAANKLHPVLKFGYDLLNASQHQPFNVADRTAQLFVPLIVGDVVDLAKEDPSLLPLIAPISLGMGSQTYDKGQTQNKFVPQGYGYDFTGGNPF